MRFVCLLDSEYWQSTQTVGACDIMNAWGCDTILAAWTVGMLGVCPKGDFGSPMGRIPGGQGYTHVILEVRSYNQIHSILQELDQPVP